MYKIYDLDWCKLNNLKLQFKITKTLHWEQIVKLSIKRRKYYFN